MTTLPDLGGKTAVVTGATGGIGLWTALGLARAGAEVTITGRSRPRLDAAADWIASQGGRGRPHTELAEFASLRAVEALAGRLAQRHQRLDILVNNAGLISPRRRVSADGYELTFAVNHLAPFVLTDALLPSLRAAPAGRVVTVASTAHQRGRLAWDDLMATRRYSAMVAYSNSKLANILFTTELARRLGGTTVTANCLHPGVVGTGFGEVGGLIGLAWRLGRPFLMTSEQGAATSLYLAASPDVAGVTGKYFARCRVATPSAAARDAASAARLRRESEALVARVLQKEVPA
jgi:NAD(P)-dependent dehydrogenase (short-subunit alcohol dehydrogenase family)